MEGEVEVLIEVEVGRVGCVKSMLMGVDPISDFHLSGFFLLLFFFLNFFFLYLLLIGTSCIAVATFYYH